MPLLFLLLIAFATGALSAYAGRDELRHSSDPVWRMETFLAYTLFVTLVLLPTAIYFYVFHGDWFLFYWVDTARAPWFWGLLGAVLLLGAASLGFRIGLALCRASRDLTTRRITVGTVLVALAIWPLAWSRLSAVGSHRQFWRDYGLMNFFSSPAFYSGFAMALIIVLAFGWLIYRVDRHTRDSV